MESDENSTQLDLFQLYRNSLSSLTVLPEDVKEDNRDISSSLMHDFLLGEKIPMQERNEKFVSPFVVHDIIHDKYYPLYYFIGEYKDNTLQRKDDLPILNQAGKEFLSSIHIELVDDISQNGIPSVYDRLKRILLSSDSLDKVELIPYFSYADRTTLLSNAIYQNLSSYVLGNQVNQKYDSLFKEIKDYAFEKKINTDTFGFFARFQRALQRVEHYHGTKVTISDPSVQTEFLLEDIHSNYKNQETILFLSSRKNKERILSFLKDNSLLDFSLDFTSFSGQDVLNSLDQLSHHTIPENLKKEIQKDKIRQERYLSFRAKKEEAYQHLYHLIREGAIQNLDSMVEKRSLFTLETEEYNDVDARKDEEFFLALDQLPDIKETYVSKFPYYGLTVPDTRDNYSRLQLILLNLVSQIKELESMLSKDVYFTKYGISLTTIHEFDSVLQGGRLLSQYNGFPRKYFRLKMEEKDQPDLEDLKLAFQALSSAKLTLSDICVREAFSMDLTFLVKEYETKHLFAKQKARKKLLSLMKVKQKKSLPTLIYVIKSYLGARNHLNLILPEYVKIYGDSVLTMNGVVEIESNIDYIRRFMEFKKVDPEFTLENTFIKKSLKEKDFRLAAVSYLEEMNLLMDKIKANIKEYREDYQDIDTGYLYDMKFASLREKFSAETMYGYEDFQEYVSFLKAKCGASDTLQKVIKESIAKKRPLKDLKEDYIYSIVYQIYSSGKEKFQPYEQDFEKVRKEYLLSMENEKDRYSLRQYQEYSSSIMDLTNRDENVDVYQTLAKEVKENNQTQKTLKDAFHLLSHCYPLSLMDIENLYIIPDDMFDQVILYDSDELPLLSLLSAYRVGKKVLFLYDQDHTDKRIVGYHESRINKESLYSKIIHYENLSPAFLEKFRSDCKEEGLILEENSSQFPLIIHDREKDYGILPDVLLTRDMDDRSIDELSKYLARFEHLHLIILDTFSYLFGDRKIEDFLLD